MPSTLSVDVPGMATILTRSPRDVNVLCPSDRGRRPDLLCMAEEQSKRQKEQLEYPNPPADKQPVKQAVRVFFHDRPTRSDAPRRNLLDNDLIASAFRTVHRITAPFDMQTTIIFYHLHTFKSTNESP